MSHLVETTTNFTSEKYILSALQKMGVNMSLVSTSSQKQHLTDYYGRKSNRQANIIVQKRGIPGSHSDVGFELMEDGKYRVHKDSMDGNRWMNKLTQSYSHSVVEDQLENQGFSLNKIETEGQELVLNFTRWK